MISGASVITALPLARCTYTTLAWVYVHRKEDALNLVRTPETIGRVPNVPRNKHRMVRFSALDWLGFGWLTKDRGTDRSAVIRELVHWWMRVPGAALPERPASGDTRAVTAALAAISAVLDDDEYVAEVWWWGLTYRGPEDRSFRVGEITKRLALRAEADAAGAAEIGRIVDENFPR